MIRLSTTTQKLQALLGGVPTTQADILVTYTDVTATTWTGGTQPSVSNSTTAVDICPAPAASTIRNIDLINIRNNDVANIVLTIRVNDNTSLYKLITVTLQVGDSLRFTHANGWGVTDSNGVLKQSPSGVTFSTGGSLSVTGVASISGNNTGDNSANSLYSGLVTMSYPGAGIALSTGTAWDTSITNSSANWNTAYGWGNHAGLYTLIANKWQWDGGATNLVAATGRTSLGLGTAATTDATAYDVAGAAAAVTPTTLGLVIGTNVQAYNSNLTAINQALTTTSSPSFTTVTAALTGTASGTAGQISTHAALQTGVHGISITAGKTFSSTGTLTLSGTDGSTLNIGTGGTLGTAAYTATTAYDVAGAAAAVTPTTLNLVIGTNVQAYDADLTTWAGITPGANVGTAIAVAVGTDGAFVVKGGALGTPSSGTATNLTGTASGLTSGTVTTNANLAGPVTSVGNTTSVATGAITNLMLAGDIFAFAAAMG